MIRNLDYLRSVSSEQFPDLGTRLYEALMDLDKQHGTLAQQVNGNGGGAPAAPPGINGLKVTGQNGHFHIQISDHNDIYRGIRYYAEYADNPNFTAPQTVYMGDVRNKTLFLGHGTYYWRAYSAYSPTAPGKPVYHGGPVPMPVSGGGSVGSPALLPSQGTGTGAPGVGLQGPGVKPFRSATGAAPVR